MVELKEITFINEKSSFESSLKDFPKEQRLRIVSVYEFAQKVQIGGVRDSGEPYYKHPKNVALILLDECKVRDPDIIVAALLHDVAEDTTVFGDMYCSRLEKQSNIARHRRIGRESAKIIIDVTKPVIINPYGLIVKDEKNVEYHGILENVGPKSLLVKMADVLHNARTLNFTDSEKQHRKVMEIEEFYLPLFKKKVLVSYPDEGKYLLKEIKIAIQNVRNGWE